jgi:protein-tyrosine phosphatase
VRSVIFVCLGNICRSPLAEGIARRIAEERDLDLRIDSAGTGDWHIGEPPCDHSVTVARKHGIDISALRARQVMTRDFECFDLVIALDAKNYGDLERLGAQKLCKLGDFGCGGEDVPDPYFFPGYEGFERVFEMVETCVAELIDTHFTENGC